MQSMTKKLLTTIALSATLLFMNSCKKDDDAGPDEPSNYMVVHSSPGSPAVELYLNDAKASASPIAYGTNSAYTTIEPKQYNVKIAAVNTINPLAETSVNLNEGQSHSIFVYDTLVSSKLKVFAVEDDLSAPPSGKAKVRFFHLSPPTTSGDKILVDIVANGTVIFPNRGYADNVSDGGKGNFVTIDAGTYNVDVRIASSSPGVPAILSVPGVVVQAGKIYTLIAKGKITGTGETALGAQLIINK